MSTLIMTISNDFYLQNAKRKTHFFFNFAVSIDNASSRQETRFMYTCKQIHFESTSYMYSKLYNFSTQKQVCIKSNQCLPPSEVGCFAKMYIYN